MAATSQPPTSQGVYITLESTGIFLTILVSASVLGGVFWGVITKINRLYSTLEEVQKTLKEQNEYMKRIERIDRDLELHQHEYANRKDVIQMLLGQLNEKIDHKFKRSLFYARDIQKYLQRTTDFRMREYEETTQTPEEE